MNRGARVASVAIVVALSAACFDALAPREPSTTPAAIFDQVWGEFDRHYSLFDAKGIDWRAVGDRYRPAALGDDSTLRAALCHMLDTLGDLHVTLYTPAGRCGATARRTDSFDPFAIDGPRYLNGNFTVSPSQLLTAGIIGPDVGYLRIGGFADDRLPAELDRMLPQADHGGGLIIDLRSNGGGNTLIAEAVAGRFVDASHVYMLARFRDGPAHSDFSAPIASSVHPAGARHFVGPIALVINRTVGSAAEDFVMAMLTRPGVVLYGDTTSGTATNPLWRDLPNGWAYRLSQSIESTPGGLAPSVVGGIPPTVFARTSHADSLVGIDPALDSAYWRLRTLAP